MIQVDAGIDFGDLDVEFYNRQVIFVIRFYFQMMFLGVYLPLKSSFGFLPARCSGRRHLLMSCAYESMIPQI